MATFQPFLLPPEVRPPASTPAPGGGAMLALQPLLTLLVALLIPCLLLLFLLNCLLLLCWLPDFARRKRKWRARQGDEQWSYAADPGVVVSSMRRPSSSCPELRVAPGCTMSVGIGQALALGEGGQVPRVRPWSAEGLQTPHSTAQVQEMGFLRPPGSAAPSMASRKQLPRKRAPQRPSSSNRARGFPVTPSSSDLEAGPSQVPPNTPESPAAAAEMPRVKHAGKTSVQRRRRSDVVLTVSPPDSVRFDYVGGGVPRDGVVMPVSADSSSAGPGLDSDFGASAGVSLRILSSDSDSCSHSWISGLEWDYYDPGYKRRAQRRRQRHQLPILCSKHYWV
ncbi:protein huluwa-like [Rhinatrema bivittatum]|uniref:protein huluwa-like n=1 Tax=Rhinatrema bivittatum TaxID=194408 RepID=UPI00112C47A6|nr:protein huluwa-like [Rhinatrema bivittatum]